MEKEDSTASEHVKLEDEGIKTEDTTLPAKRRRGSEDTKPTAKRRKHYSRARSDGKCSGKRHHHKRKSAEFTFHLGGSISDPLNLEGLSGSGHECTTCPPSPSPQAVVQQQPSPLPPHRRRDPLNLEGTLKEDKKGDRSKKRKRSKSARTRSVSKGPEQGESKAVLSDDAFQGSSAVTKVADQSKSGGQTTDRVPNNGNITCSDDASSSLSAKLQKGKNAKFRYGNYTRYYGYRNSGSFASDSRLKLMQMEWFDGKTVLDIGCNTGQVTMEIAQKFKPKSILGIDIDEGLIKMAKKNVIRVIPLRTDIEQGSIQFPMSFSKVFGPIAVSNDLESNGAFPNNIRFKQENFVPLDDASIDQGKPKYHVILALSLTKWIHLNWGDIGIKRMFKKIHSCLLPGGMFIMEPQPFLSYTKKKYLTHEIFQNYSSISFKPEEFNEYLLGPEVGFVECLPLGTPENPSKGFQRPLEMYIKKESA